MGLDLEEKEKSRELRQKVKAEEWGFVGLVLFLRMEELWFQSWGCRGHHDDNNR